MRFNFSRHLGARTPIADVIAMTPRLAEIGWHLQVHFDSALIDELAPHLARSAATVVIDHMGRVDASLGLDQPAFRTLRKLLAHEFVWVKVSGCDRISKAGPPYADAVPFARALVAEFGDRSIWGTDWPHPNHTHVPDDGVLVDLLAQIAPSEAMRPDAAGRQSAAALRVSGERDWPMNRRLEGKVAVIAGAGSVGPGWGNGRAIAFRFAQEGARMFAVDRDLSRRRRDARPRARDPRRHRSRTRAT